MAHLIKKGTNLLSIAGSVFGIKDNFRVSFRQIISVLFPISADYDPRVGKNRIWIVSAVGNKIIVINTIDKTVITEITGGSGTASEGKFDPFNPTRFYFCKGNEVRIYDTDTYELIDVVSGFSTPQSIAFDAANNRFFISNYGNATISIVDISTLTIVDNLTDFNTPRGLCIDLDNNRLFVALVSDGQVKVINATTFATVATIGGFSSVYFMNIDPNTDKNRVLVGNNGDNTIKSISRTSLAVNGSLKVGDSNTFSAFFDPFNSLEKFYVVDYGYSRILEVKTAIV